MKKVLIICYHFPPQATVHARRMGKYCKYLEDYGWHPVVLTAKNPEVPLTDASFFDEVRDKITLYKTFDLFSFSFLRKHLMNRSEILSPEEKNSRSTISSLFNNIFVNLVRMFLLDNQNRIGWLLPVFLKSRQIIRTEKIDLIFTFPLPYSVNLVGYLLSRLTGIPWVAESPGSWTFEPSLPSFKVFSSNKFNNWVIRLTIGNCAKLFTGYPGIAELFKRKFPSFSDNIRPLIAGYDEADFQGNEPPKSKDEFVITYTGNFYSPLQLEKFLEAVRMSIDEQPELKRVLRIKFLSNLSKSSYRYRIIEKYQLQSVVELFPIMPFKKCVEYIRSSDVLMLSQVTSEWSRLGMGTKGFDYIRAGKPILALVPLDGSLASLIRETRTGVVVDLCDVEGIKNELLLFFEKHKRGELAINPDYDVVRKYSVQHVVEQLSKAMAEAVRGRRA